MADNTKIRQPEDPQKINLGQQWEIDYWTKALGVSESELRNAVNAVGVMVKDVKDYLKTKKAMGI